MSSARRPLVDAAAHAGQQVDGLAAGQRRPQRDIAWHVGDLAVQRDGVGPRVAAEQSQRCRASARTRPSRTRMVVDLPAPLGRGSRAPRLRRPVRSRPSSARTEPKFLVRPRTSMAAVELAVMSLVLFLRCGRDDRNALCLLGDERVVHRRIGHQALRVDLECGQHHVLGVVVQDGAQVGRVCRASAGRAGMPPPPVIARNFALALGSRLGLMVPARTPSSMYCSALSIILRHNVFARSPPVCMLRTR